MRDLWIQQLGWEHAKASFIRHYDETFTEPELRELHQRLDKPLLRKLLAVEGEALEVTADERAAHFADFWLRYNNLEFEPPK